MIDLSKTLVSLVVLVFAGVSNAQQSGEAPVPGDQIVPVAEEMPEVADDGLSDEEMLIAEFERYKQYINEGSMDEADVAAKRIVEMAIRLYGPQSLETAKALNNLALVQNKTGQYDAAIQNFESAIEIIEFREDRLNGQLVNPLKGLGSSQLANGRPDLAAQTFNRATHITHVNDGPHNIEQVELLESLAESTLRMGDMEGARDLLNRIHILNVRHFDNNELGLIPSLMRRADWQHRAGYYNDERATYRRAIRIVEAKLGKNDPQLILPLRRLGESFYFIDVSQSGGAQQGVVATGEIYFKRAARIAENSDEIGWEEYADVQLALGDYYIFVEAHNRARKVYKGMWEFLATDEERLAMRREVLEQPVVLKEDSLPGYAGVGAPGPTSEVYLNGTIRVDYTVSRRGRVRNIRTEAIPPQFAEMQRIVHREVRKRIFRPLVVDAQPTDSGDLVLEHSFLYRQSDLDKLLQQTAPQKREEAAATEDSSET